MKDGWETRALADVCEFQRGLTYSKCDEVDFSSNVVLRANNVDLAKNQLDLSELKYINDQIQIPFSKVLGQGSLLICTASGSKSHLGKVAFIDKDYGHAFGGFMGQITPLPSILSRFLFYALTSESYKRFVSALQMEQILTI
jgi:type I restriction enzyme S subunit